MKILFFLFLCPLFYVSCQNQKPVLSGFPDKTAFTVSQKGKLFFEYKFKEPVPISQDLFLALQYRTEQKLDILFVVNGADSWEFKADPAPQIRYVVPVSSSAITTLTVSTDTSLAGSIEVQSLSLVPRWYGFERTDDALSITAFVQYNNGIYTIDRPSVHGPASLSALGTNRVAVEAGGTRFEADGSVYIPSGILPAQAFPVFIEGASSARLVENKEGAFNPVKADPALVLQYPQSEWRNSRYEVFSWEQFPSVLIFDTASYAVQDKLLKRLAFFVEKAGFRGRLARDSEIASLHGWNAHDYRAYDLARFFDQALRTNFPLNDMEEELQALLLHNGIIRRVENGFEAGEGAIISISRASSGTLRERFITHEGFHGIFFIDEGLRTFSRRRFDSFSDTAKRFILSYFEYMQYDITDEYLLVNEFMAYILQQPVSQAGSYFGRTLAGQIASHPWRYTVLPRPYNSGAYPQLTSSFQEEAQAFSSYVQEHFGLSAGNVSRLTISRINS